MNKAPKRRLCTVFALCKHCRTQYNAPAIWIIPCYPADILNAVDEKTCKKGWGNLFKNHKRIVPELRDRKNKALSTKYGL